MMKRLIMKNTNIQAISLFSGAGGLDIGTKQNNIELKVSIDNEKKIIVSIRKADLAKESADARPEVFSPGNALDAKITELDLNNRKIKLSVKAAQIDEEKSLVAKFGEGATKSGATLKGIFEKALGRKNNKKKDK